MVLLTRRRVLRAALLLAAALLIVGGLMFSLQRTLIFPRFVIPPPPDGVAESVPGLVRFALPVDGGEVEAWFIPGDGVSPDKPGPVVIFSHGNGELIDYWPDMLAGYSRMGISLLLPEFRGYGRSAGSPSEKGITEDMVGFYDLLIARPEVDPKRIVFHGRSMGGGAVCALSRQRPPAAMILMSTYTSIREMARRYLMPAFLVRDPFENLQAIEELNRPLLLLHGKKDKLIPFNHAERLHAAASGSKLIAYPEADHNDCPPDWDGFWREARKFFGEAGILK